MAKNALVFSQNNIKPHALPIPKRYRNDTRRIQPGYRKDTETIQPGYRKDTAGIQRGYTNDTARIQKTCVLGSEGIRRDHKGSKK